MSAVSIADTVVMPLVVFTCVILVALFIWLQTRRHMAKKYDMHFDVPEEGLLMPPTAAISRHGAARSGAIPITTSCHNQWHSQTTTAGRDTAMKATYINRELEVCAADGLKKPRVNKQASASVAPPKNCKLSPLPRAPSLRYETVRSQPLLSPRIDREDMLEQQLWRNSSGGSSCYSRPSSWQSNVTEARSECGWERNNSSAGRHKVMPLAPLLEYQGSG